MTVKIIKKDDEYISVGNLIDEIKKAQRVDEAGAIYSFEGIVRGEEEDLTVDKLVLSLADEEKALEEINAIIETAKVKHGVFEISVVHYIGEFYTGDSLFLVVVLGPHRGETLEALTEVVERVKHEIDFKKEEISNKGTKVIMAGG
ncbi:molybdenum cofactor biosynthesis protein MoaE [uncultured Methanobrevibacter sp.]|uniref:molybdenum cofactor biosynthesis protein MoaE n=1 Tax=uncultured Methanobrevibacter sp. TaxID=253161 RepID=UPI0026084A56